MVVGKPASTSAAELAADRLLVESAQKDLRKFADLYDKYFCLVYAYTARRVADRATAEDLTSEVFQKALEYLPKFVWRGVPLAPGCFASLPTLSLIEPGRQRASSIWTITKTQLRLVISVSRKLRSGNYFFGQ